MIEIKLLCTGLLKHQNKLCQRRWKTSEAFERNFFSFYPHSFPHSFSKVEKLYLRKIHLNTNPFIDLFPGFFKRTYKKWTRSQLFWNDFANIGSYQNLGAAISMEHFSNCFCISGGRPSPNHIWPASWICFYNSSV